MNAPLRIALLSLALAASASSVRAADTGAPPEPEPAAASDPLAAARAQIAAKRWDRAIAELKRVNATSSADWNNLMGYALRKHAVPDLEGAQRHYDAALRIDPRHRGALEYAGELALMKGDLPRAESYAATLGQTCPAGCEELADLKQAVARYKSNGNRYLP
jgi:tetratricopeptide (TPR) repeat protein